MMWHTCLCVHWQVSVPPCKTCSQLPSMAALRISCSAALSASLPSRRQMLAELPACTVTPSCGGGSAELLPRALTALMADCWVSDPRLLNPRWCVQLELPPIVPAGQDFMDPQGAYLLFGGRSLVLWLGRGVHPAFLQQVGAPLLQMPACLWA